MSIDLVEDGTLEPNFLAVCAFCILGLLLSHRVWLVFPEMPEIMSFL
jgi:hypothetical protein